MSHGHARVYPGFRDPFLSSSVPGYNGSSTSTGGARWESGTGDDISPRIVRGHMLPLPSGCCDRDQDPGLRALAGEQTVFYLASPVACRWRFSYPIFASHIQVLTEAQRWLGSRDSDSGERDSSLTRGVVSSSSPERLPPHCRHCRPCLRIRATCFARAWATTPGRGGNCASSVTRHARTARQEEHCRESPTSPMSKGAIQIDDHRQHV